MDESALAKKLRDEGFSHTFVWEDRPNTHLSRSQPCRQNSPHCLKWRIDSNDGRQNPILPPRRPLRRPRRRSPLCPNRPNRLSLPNRRTLTLRRFPGYPDCFFGGLGRSAGASPLRRNIRLGTLPTTKRGHGEEEKHDVGSKKELGTFLVQKNYAQSHERQSQSHTDGCHKAAHQSRLPINSNSAKTSPEPSPGNGNLGRVRVPTHGSCKWVFTQLVGAL